MKINARRQGITKGEVRAISILCLLLVLAYILPRWLLAKQEPTVVDPNRVDALYLAFTTEDTHVDNTDSLMVKPQPKAMEPSPFNPNAVTAETLVSFGLPSKTAQTWERFVEGGGRFYNPKDIEKVYGLTEEQVEALLPFVRIPKAKTTAPSPTAHQPKKEIEPREPISLNRADTTELMTLRGIGPVFSQRIVKYRDWLGGFHSLDQLDAVYGLPPETLVRLKENVSIDTSQITHISLGEASAFSLSKHPYIEKDQAEELLRYWQNDSLKRIDSLNKDAIFEESTWRLLRPYLRK